MYGVRLAKKKPDVLKTEVNIFRGFFQLLQSECWNMGSEAVRVVVRCRPLNDREKALGSKMVLSMDLHRCQCFIEKPGAVDEPAKQFTFDGTYFIDQTTEQMYNEIAYPLVEVS